MSTSAAKDNDGKQCKSMEESNATEENSSKRKVAQNNSENGVKKQGKDNASKFPEPQSAAATDSHSLTERICTVLETLISLTLIL
ncbi:hypothetical protein GUJ93_ZPchr0006g43469 [Zizania palustris]|uniref:Uncharacterized protein n=1 Tax=Zizania palustris TaxID=103762 RepID=A0A8J5T500_ZIZPA|nr:hypothetical protein GUJ93_ZPchr0006g43469 [Zizania palustris]